MKTVCPKNHTVDKWDRKDQGRTVYWCSTCVRRYYDNEVREVKEGLELFVE